MNLHFLDSGWITYIIIPVFILMARVVDVSLGTIRIIFVSRNKKLWAPFLGFFESFVFILAITQIMKNLHNVFCFLAYATGFACGTLIGIIIEEKLAIGRLVVKIILTKNGTNLVKSLSEAGYGVTIVDGHGAHEKVNLIYTVIDRKHFNHVEEIIQSCNSKAFYSVEDARTVCKGVFPSGKGCNIQRK